MKYRKAILVFIGYISGSRVRGGGNTSWSLCDVTACQVKATADLPGRSMRTCLLRKTFSVANQQCQISATLFTSWHVRLYILYANDPRYLLSSQTSIIQRPFGHRSATNRIWKFENSLKNKLRKILKFRITITLSWALLSHNDYEFISYLFWRVFIFLIL